MAKRKKYESHGLSKDRLYPVWVSMIARCYSGRCKEYQYYGSRGIRVCEDWRHSPVLFIRWAKEHCKDPKLQLDRIDNDENYSPENCHFVASAINNMNKRYRQRYGTSQYVGVHRNLGDVMFKAQLRVQGRIVHLGSFDSELGAAIAREVYIQTRRLPNKLNFPELKDF